MEPCSYVYFVHATESGRIKIGTADDPVRRLATLQTGSPEQLDLIGTLPGGRALEARLHRDFARERLRGEWFECSDRLVLFLGDRLGWGRLTDQQAESARKAAAAWAEFA